MKSIKLILFLAVINVFSCSTDEEDAPKVEPAFVTINVHSTLPAAGRVWAFITDSRGDVVSSQKLSIGSNKFTGMIPDTINVTLFEYSVDIQKHYRFTTYPDVAPNSVIILDQANGLGWYSLLEYPLSAKISVTNFEEPSNTSTQLTVTDGYSYGYTQSLPPEMTLPLHNSTVNVLVSGFKGDSSNPVYGLINGVRNGDIKSIDFNNFVPFDKVLSLPNAFHSAYIGGYKLDGTKKVSFTMFSSLVQTSALPEDRAAKVGYLDGFDLYETFVSSSRGIPFLGSTTIYRRLGTVNPTITLPEYEMTISNDELGNFSFTYTANSNFQLHTWRYIEDNNYVYWDVYSNDNSLPIFKTIPENILTQFPALNFSKFEHEASTFYHCSDGYDYDDYFQDFQKGNYPFTNPDYYELTFQSR